MKITLKSVLSFVRRNKIKSGLVGALLFILLAPSCDRLEEAHGFMRSGLFTIGNGILVGCEIEGRPRVAFLTCRHVLTGRMLTTNKAFVDCSSKVNYIYLNKRGRGFGYVGLNEIDPARWLTVKELEHDFAWIILSESEISRVAGSADQLPYVDIAEKGRDRPWGHVGEESFHRFTENEECGPFVYSLFSPVFGPPSDPSSQFFVPSVLGLPWFGRSWGVVTRQGARMTCSDRAVPWPKVSFELCGLKREMTIPLYRMKWASHVNKSGSPVFIKVDENGEKGFALAGLVTTTDNEDTTGFQSLNAVLPAIRKSLAGEEAYRVVDMIQSMLWR